MLRSTPDVDDGLRPASTRVGLRPYMHQVMERRQYMVYVASSTLRSQRMNTFLGNLWHLLNPSLQIAVTYVIFGVVLGVDRGVDNFIAFLAVGIFAYQFTTRSTMRGSNAVIMNARLIKSFVFPRLILPLTSSVETTLAFLPTVIIMLAVPLLTGEPVRLTWLALPAIIALQIVFNAGLALFAARATFHIPDIQQLLPFAFRMGFYASGVIFLVDAYVARGYRWLFIINPLYCFVALYRWAVLGFDLDPMTLPSALIWAGVASIGGMIWFRRAEDKYARG